MRRFALIFGSVFLVFFFLFYFFPSQPVKNDYYKYFMGKKAFYEKRFKSKIRSKAPAWMEEQIKEDLASFSNKKISLDSLDKTYAAIHTPERVMRYRIVGNQLYYYKVKHCEPFDPSGRFQRALLTLCRLTSLPNLDLIITHEDGTKIPFYLTEEEKDQAPIFGWAKLKTTPYLVLIPDYRSISPHWFDDIRKLKEGKNFVGKQLPWSEKETKAFWRGGLTEPIHRLKIAQLSITFPNKLDAGITPPHEGHPYEKPNASYEQHMQYKYLPVLDGVMCSYLGYQWRLLSGSLTLKQESDQIQWFYRALKPYFHYLPIANDLSDLLEKIDWARDHDQECEQMAKNAKMFVLENLMFDDVYLYLYLVLNHYASCLDKSMDVELKKTVRDPDWALVQILD